MTEWFKGVNKDIARPNYDEDVDAIVALYEQAIIDIQNELNNIFLSDMQRGFLLSREEQIRLIITDLNNEAIGLTSELMIKSAEDGIANTLLSLGLAETAEQARRMVTFGELNRPYIEAVLADVQSDLLAVTDHTSRKTKQVIRKGVADGMRAVYAQGGGQGDDVQKAVMDILKQVKKDFNEAIVDNAGRKWKLETYIRMATSTKAMHVHRDASINAGVEQGEKYAVISSHGAKDACRHYEGKLVSIVPGKNEYGVPYVEELPFSEIFHPNCKHYIVTVPNPERYL